MPRQVVHMAAVWTKDKTEVKAENSEYKAKVLEALRALLLRNVSEWRTRTAVRVNQSRKCIRN